MKPSTASLIFLTTSAEQNGWKLVYYKAAHSAVQFHWGDGPKSYRHSFIIVNVSDLLFYLRSHALETHPLWAEAAKAVFPADGVKLDANARNETTIRLRTYYEAQLAEQLFLRPLPKQ
jgi:hypothetical protein